MTFNRFTRQIRVSYPKHNVQQWSAWTLLLTLFTGLWASHASAAPHQSRFSSQSLDKQIAATLDTLVAGDLVQARVLARQLAVQFPDYALGQLISADLESAAAFHDVKAAGITPMSQTLVDLLLEAQARLHRNDNQLQNQLPDEVIQLGQDVSQLLLFDLSDSTLYHMMGNGHSSDLVRQHYIGSGKAGFGKQIEGDNKTPLGIYTISGLRSDGSLPDLYGSGALVLNYPNALDRHLGRTGSGIWIHGVPHAQRSRAPRSSEGCVTMSNDHLISLRDQITPSDTLVVLSHDLHWSNAKERHSRQQEYQQLFKRYQHAWTEGNEAELVALYESPDHLLKHRESNQLKVNTSVVSARPNITRSPFKRPQHYLNALAALAPADISIIRNPTLSTTPNSQHIVMRARFGTVNEYQLTLYWGYGNDGEWRVITEQWAGMNL